MICTDHPSVQTFCFGKPLPQIGQAGYMTGALTSHKAPERKQHTQPYVLHKMQFVCAVIFYQSRMVRACAWSQAYV